MKRLIKFLPLALVCVLACAMASCSDDDNDDRLIVASSLPTAAKTFISTYYPGQTVVTATIDKNEYDVVLSNRHSIDFNNDGEWLDVDAPAGQTVPTGFYPEAINSYIAANCSGAGINEISRESRGYDVELTSGTDLFFNLDGTLLAYERTL